MDAANSQVSLTRLVALAGIAQSNVVLNKSSHVHISMLPGEPGAHAVMSTSIHTHVPTGRRVMCLLDDVCPELRVIWEQHWPLRAMFPQTILKGAIRGAINIKVHIPRIAIPNAVQPASGGQPRGFTIRRSRANIFGNCNSRSPGSAGGAQHTGRPLG